MWKIYFKMLQFVFLNMLFFWIFYSSKNIVMLNYYFYSIFDKIYKYNVCVCVLNIKY